MDVTSAYMYTVKELQHMFEAIEKAQVPPRFTYDFLRSLGFKSTNDRAFINVLKGLGLLDSNSVPTPAYREYRDSRAAKQVLARQLRHAYEGLFLADENAQDLTVDAVKGKLATLTGKDDAVVKKMATTFKALAALADFKSAPATEVAEPIEERVESPALEAVTPKPSGFSFSHTIFINLPATRDVAVYDAIFKSIREHLL
jgi:hypothetical protein